MTDNKFKIEDFGDLSNDLKKILQDYELENKDKVLEILIDAILGKVQPLDLIELFSDKLELDFNKAGDLAYDLKTSILDKQEKLEPIKKNLQDKTANKFSPPIMTDELLAKLPEFKIKNDNIRQRFLEALVSWLKDVRDFAELKEVMTRSDKIGGVGMPEESFYKLRDLLEVKKEEMEKEDVDINEVIAEYEKSLPEEFVMPKSDVVQETNIDVESKPVKPETKPEKTTGEEVTIDQLLKDQGVEFEELAHKEAIKRELKEKEEFIEKKEESADLADKIEDKEDFLETNEELAPPPPMAAQSDSAKEEKKEPGIEKNVNLSAKEKDPFADFDFAPNSIQDTPTSVKAKKGIAQDKQSQVTVAKKESIKKNEVTSQAPAESQTPPADKQVSQQPIFKKQEKQGGRPKVEDVKFTPRLYGPIEELASFTIADFRRLSKDPQEATSKLKEKLNLLEDESLVKKVEGIKALKKSPLYKIYADIMNKAINQGKSFEQVIEETDELELLEFKSIMELNKNLKY
ncbi:MAG: hypothetical protein GF365_01240|nr:hypothetical protein [Candidatus Buchananbacteria bacterium]